jgi:hypothetical protein
MLAMRMLQGLNLTVEEKRYALWYRSLDRNWAPIYIGVTAYRPLRIPGVAHH